MKNVLSLVTGFVITFYSFAQRGDAATQLMNSNEFISWAAKTANNEWLINVDFKEQLGDRFTAFKKRLRSASTSAEMNQVVAEYNLNTEFSYDMMVEHIAYGLMFRQKNPWLWNLPEPERKEIIKSAYFHGMSSIDPRWTTMRDSLVTKIQLRCGIMGKSIATVIVSCLWNTISEAAGIISIGGIITAINSGSFSGMVSAIKKFLKAAGRSFGWFGLAWAAIDIGVCILNDM